MNLTAELLKLKIKSYSKEEKSAYMLGAIHKSALDYEVELLYPHLTTEEIMIEIIKESEQDIINTIFYDEV